MWSPCVCELFPPPWLLWCYYVKTAHLVAPGIICTLVCSPALGHGPVSIPCPAFPCLCDGTALEAALSAGHGCVLVPRNFLQVSGHQDLAAPCKAVTQVHLLLFLNVGVCLGRHEPCKTCSHSSPPGTELTAGRASAPPENCWEWRQTTGSF